MPKATIPSKNNIHRSSGTLFLTISREKPILAKEILLRIGDFELAMETDELTLSSKGKTLELSTLAFYGPTTIDEYTGLVLEGKVTPGEVYEIQENNEYIAEKRTKTIVWSWVNNTHGLMILDKEYQTVSHRLFDEKELDGQFDTIQLANQPYWQGHYRDIAIYMADSLYEEPTYRNIERFQTREDILFKADYTIPTHYANEPIVETTMAPRDQSPVLVENAKGPMRRQYFFDHQTGLYQKTNTETFLFRNDTVLHLSYDKIDPQFPLEVVFADGERFVSKHIDDSQHFEEIYFEGNAVYFRFTDEQRELFYGQDVSITYQLTDSYNIEYNDDTAYDSLKVHLINHDSKQVKVIQEGNRFSNQKLAKEIELNPLLNPQHTGFLYLDKEEQTIQSFRLNTSSPYVTADGADSADFIIEGIDEEGNEVLNPEIEVYILKEDGRIGSDLGTIHPIITKETLKARKTSGRCYYRYKAPFIRTEDNPLIQRLFLVAYDRKSGLGAQVPLFIRPTNQTAIYNITEESANKASLPFEMMTRYLNRKLDPTNPVLLLDFNRNGILDDEDFAYLEANKTNLAMMTSLDASLRIRMGINRDEMDVPSRFALGNHFSQTYIIDI